MIRYLKDEKFFNEGSHKLKYYDMKDIASHLTLEYFKQGENVFKAGDVGDKFYIVLRGVI